MPATNLKLLSGVLLPHLRVAHRDALNHPSGHPAAHEVLFACRVVLVSYTTPLPVAQSGGQALEADEQFEQQTALQHHEV
jgi:hypothetical protein